MLGMVKKVPEPARTEIRGLERWLDHDRWGEIDVEYNGLCSVGRQSR